MLVPLDKQRQIKNFSSMIPDSWKSFTACRSKKDCKNISSNYFCVKPTWVIFAVSLSEIKTVALLLLFPSIFLFAITHRFQYFSVILVNK